MMNNLLSREVLPKRWNADFRNIKKQPQLLDIKGIAVCFFREELMKSKINILITPQNPKTNSLKMPEITTKIYCFSLCFIAFSIREMGFGEVGEYGQKKTVTKP